jgi:hypothetical protein
MPRLSLMTATVGSDKYFFQGNPITYDAVISVATGITVAADTDQDEAPHKVNELTRTGILKRIAVSVRVGTELKTQLLFCAIDKLTTVLDGATGLKGKTAFGGTITSVRIPRKAKTY